MLNVRVNPLLLLLLPLSVSVNVSVIVIVSVLIPVHALVLVLILTYLLAKSHRIIGRGSVAVSSFAGGGYP